MGAPGRRDEYWKFTNPATLIDPATPKAGIFKESSRRPFSDIDRVMLVFVDGVFDPEQSDDPTLAGVRRRDEDEQWKQRLLQAWQAA